MSNEKKTRRSKKKVRVVLPKSTLYAQLCNEDELRNANILPDYRVAKSLKDLINTNFESEDFIELSKDFNLMTLMKKMVQIYSKWSEYPTSFISETKGANDSRYGKAVRMSAYFWFYYLSEFYKRVQVLRAEAIGETYDSTFKTQVLIFGGLALMVKENLHEGILDLVDYKKFKATRIDKILLDTFDYGKTLFKKIDKFEEGVLVKLICEGVNEMNLGSFISMAISKKALWNKEMQLKMSKKGKEDKNVKLGQTLEEMIAIMRKE
ncbi:MAG: hypothetical protein DRN30_06505, partial [Thermoplasmata archaeon]